MEICYCYEKFKKDLPEGVKTTCFKDKCANYRRNTEERDKSLGQNTEIKTISNQ